VLLSDVSFMLEPGELLCILGPSGSGKSTLLNVLSGRQIPSAGTVALNGQDLHANFAAMKEDLAVVPQSTALYTSLTVERMLEFTAALRLPPDLSRAELVAAVDEIVRTVGLEHRKGARIANLSGGQLKRAGLANELLAQPSLVFLDEVTSGLDEQADGEMMRLFRGLADAGKTVVCITHNLAHVEENAHLVLVLTVGGQLAFFGRPHEAKQHFGTPRLADVYAKLATRPPDEWAAHFATSPACAAYVWGRLPKKDPAGALFGQALLVTVLLGIVFGDLESVEAGLARTSATRNLLLLTAISSFWLGCNNAAKEIVKERRIYERERNFNLLPEAYFAS
jgi:ABC-type multidrug transport system ATPase subunit